MKTNFSKQVLVDAVIDDLKKSFESSDYTVLDELLRLIPKENLIQALPEEQWEMFENINNSIWEDIVDEYVSDEIIYIDAWLTCDINEEGRTIAKIDLFSNEVTYLDERAKTDEYAQKVIFNITKNLL